MENKPPQKSPLSFPDLPAELQMRILEESDLAQGEAYINLPTVNNGTIHPLLDSSNPRLSAMALEVFLKGKRLIFIGTTKQIHDWLRAQGDAVWYIRSIVLEMPRQLCEGSPLVKPVTTTGDDWKELISFIADNLDLPKLTLSIDNSNWDLEHLEVFSRAGRQPGPGELFWGPSIETVAVLAQKGLKDLWLFSLHPNLSHKQRDCQKHVMGADYETVGKVPWSLFDLSTYDDTSTLYRPAIWVSPGIYPNQPKMIYVDDDEDQSDDDDAGYRSDGEEPETGDIFGHDATTTA